MAIILNLETATQVCSVVLAKDGKLLGKRELNEKNVHAEVLTPFIEEVIEEAGLKLSHLDAVAVSKGPGSYTGLRIGVSTAKGLCYSLDKPLISVGTLDSLAHYAVKKLPYSVAPNHLLCPMIDARRMEVYAALFNSELHKQTEVAPLILDEQSFNDLKEGQKLILLGDGSGKTKALFKHRSQIEIHEEILCSAEGMVQISEEKFNQEDFEDLAYFEPCYLKEFIAGIPKVKGLR
jgi:tRNA threonylcarbamoyladenosine biosynthesis protein TsaB